MCETNGNKTWNKSSDPLICFDFNEFINPKSIVEILKSFVFHGAARVDEILKGAGEIIVIWEVEILIL